VKVIPQKNVVARRRDTATSFFGRGDFVLESDVSKCCPLGINTGGEVLKYKRMDGCSIYMIELG